MHSHTETLPSVPGAFDVIAETYDSSFTNSAVGSAQRQSVWKEMDRTFTSEQRILEINCGTGVDALHLARRGVKVVACDSSPGMIAMARQRLTGSQAPASVDFRILAVEEIADIADEELFDGVLSNFAGLNCLPDLTPVACDLARLIRPHGKAVLCLFGRFCLWETVWYLARRDFSKAFRRLRRTVVAGNLSSGSAVDVWYPSVRRLKQVFSPYFFLKSWKGVGVVVPPSSLEPIATRFRRLFRIAAAIDPWLGQCPGVRATADHMVLTFERSITCAPPFSNRAERERLPHDSKTTRDAASASDARSAGVQTPPW